MAKEKSAAAQELGRMRAKKLSPERRSQIASIAGSANLTALTAEQRVERARKAIAARWAKAKKGTK